MLRKIIKFRGSQCFWLILLFLNLGLSSSYAQTTYYSRAGASLPQDWDNADSWTLVPDGSGLSAGPPGRMDNVVILAGHTIRIDSTGDNGVLGVSPDALGLANVGPFTASSIEAFYQTGDILINEGGALETVTQVKLMIAGKTSVSGALNVSGDFINLGDLYLTSTSSMTTQDDLILSGTSSTRIDNSLSTSSDDIYIDHIDAKLCGTGSIEIGINPDVAEIEFFNGADETQICTSFTITGCAVVVGCPTCISSCPSFTGTVDFTIDFPTAPVLSGSGVVLSYTENDVSVVDPSIGIVFSEPALLSASASITSNFVAVEDSLAFIAISGISASYDGLTGVLSLSGYSDIATWQSALRNITYENLSDNPSTATRTLTFEITDGLSTSNLLVRDIAISPVNDQPAVTSLNDPSAPLAYTEGDFAVMVDDQIQINDPDDVNIEGATITLMNYEVGEDILEFNDSFGVSKVDFNATTGILTLTGSTLITNYEMALQSVTYENLSGDPIESSRTAEFVVNDGVDVSPAFGREIVVSAVNTAPVIAGTITAIDYIEGAGAILLDDLVTVSDVDNVNLSAATVTVIANYQENGDVLSFVDQNGITGNFTNGVLTLSGVSSIANYQTALRSVIYENVSENPSAVVRTISLVINDGGLNSLAFERDINMSPVNDLPVFTGSTTTITYTEGDGSVILDNLLTVSDVDNTDITLATVSISTNYQAGEDVLVFADQNGIVGSFSGGILTLTGSSSLLNYQMALQSITYENTSEDPLELERTILIDGNDGIDDSNVLTISMTLVSVNDAPSIQGSSSDVNFMENGTPVVLDDALVLTDIDDLQLSQATVTISNNYQVNEDLLAFSDQLGISGQFDTNSGTLMLTGPATVGDFQIALRSVTYQSLVERSNFSIRSLEFIVDDGDLTSPPFVRNLTVEAVITALNSELSTELIRIYPNPIKDLLSVEAEFFAVANYSLMIMDLSGKTYFNKQVSGNSGINIHEVDVSMLPNGIFAVVVIQEDKVLTQKIVK